MNRYLIEFRFQGKIKRHIKQLIWEINNKCRLKGAKRKRAIPHITLVAPFTTKNEKRLIRDFNRVCSKYPLMKFGLKGFNKFKNSRVVYIDINPSKKLDEFRWELSKRLQPYCKLKPIDYKRKYYFHATLAMKLTHPQFKRVKAYVQKKQKPEFKHIVVRATLLKGSRILREYDFLLRRPLTRRLAKSRGTYRKTMYLLKKYFDGKYNPNKKIERIEISRKKESLFRRILKWLK